MKDVLDRKILSLKMKTIPVEQQRLSAEDLKNNEIESTINTLKANKKLNLIPTFEGKIKSKRSYSSKAC